MKAFQVLIIIVGLVGIVAIIFYSTREREEAVGPNLAPSTQPVVLQVEVRLPENARSPQAIPDVYLNGQRRPTNRLTPLLLQAYGNGSVKIQGRILLKGSVVASHFFPVLNSFQQAGFSSVDLSDEAGAVHLEPLAGPREAEKLSPTLSILVSPRHPPEVRAGTKTLPLAETRRMLSDGTVKLDASEILTLGAGRDVETKDIMNLLRACQDAGFQKLRLIPDPENPLRTTVSTSEPATTSAPAMTKPRE